MAKPLETIIYEVQEWLGTGSINFFGKPFAGKDSQAAIMGSKIGAPVLGGGDIIRNSVIPPDVREIMDQGGLIPSDNYRAIVLPFLGQTAFKDNPLMLSAVGRMAGEEPGVLAATEAAGHPIKLVPYLSISDDEALRRLEKTGGRGRDDDTPESLRKRLEGFRELTMPVLDTYEGMGLLVEVDAMGPKDIVFSTLVHMLHERARAA